MKIIESNSNILRLRSDPYFQIIFGLIFALSGIAVLYFFGRSVDVVCQKTSTNRVTCELTEKLIGIVPIGQRTVVDIRSAEVEEHRDSDGDYTFQVVFVTVDGRKSLTSYTSSGYRDKADVADRLNAFIQGGRQNQLELQVPMEWWILLFPVIFGGVGISSVVMSKTVLIDLSSAEGLMRIQKNGLFGNSKDEHPLRDIEEVYLQKSRSSRRGNSTYRIVFRMIDGEEISTSRMYSSGYKGKQRAVEAINAFLKPYQRPQDWDPFA